MFRRDLVVETKCVIDSVVSCYDACAGKRANPTEQDIQPQTLGIFRNRQHIRNRRRTPTNWIRPVPLLPTCNQRDTMTSKQLLAARKALGLTQQAMADKMGTPKRTYQDWEYGVYPVTGSASKLVEIFMEGENAKSM